MKTIKVIDLLNMIANRGEVPNYIHCFNRMNGEELTMLVDKESIIYKLNEGVILLNDEVEVIEEDKKIERITNEAFLNSPFGELVGGKINEIIDYINKNKEEK